MGIKLTSKTSVTLSIGDDTVKIIYNTPWDDPEFVKRHQTMLESRYKMSTRGRKSKMEAQRTRVLADFARKQLDDIPDFELDGKPIKNFEDWQYKVPAHWLTSSASVIFEESDAEPSEAVVLKKSKSSSK